MPYLVKGNALQVFSAFGHPELAALTDASDIRDRDFLQTPFLGTALSAKMHQGLWRHKLSGQYYAQGNMSANILKCLFGEEPLKGKDEKPEAYKQQFVCKNFAFIDNHLAACGLIVMHRRDKPGQWAVGLIRKTQYDPKHREITLLSSFDLTSKINCQPNPEIKLKVDKVSLTNNQLMNDLGSAFPGKLLKQVFPEPKGMINKHFERIDLLTRFLSITPEGGVSIDDPVDFSKLDLERLFADNKALDLIIKYNIHRDLHLPFAQLVDCLSENSGLCKALEGVKLTDNEQVNKNLLQMTLVYYEEAKAKKEQEERERKNKDKAKDDKEKEIILPHQELLANHEFIRLFGGFMWDRIQIKLIPVLYKRNCAPNLMRLVLSEEPYFNAVSRLAEMNYLQDVPTLFQDKEKLEQLKYIHSLHDEDAKRLCLVFWVKGNLSLEGYEKIVQEAKKYPLMATTLVDLDRKNVIRDKIIGLENLAFQPRKHLEKSIKHHFFAEPGENYYTQKLDEFSKDELEAASQSLNALRSAGITEREKYRLVIDAMSPGKAKALRIFLPQIANAKELINDVNRRKELIDVLYAGVTGGVAHQGQVVTQIAGEISRARANNLCERFICVSHLQELAFDDAEIVWAAQEGNIKAKYFRQVIMRVEEQCKIISTRLNGSGANNNVRDDWRDSESDYRKKLYKIAFTAFTKSTGTAGANFEEAKQQIMDVEKDILALIDPPINSPLHKALIVLANIVITALSIGILNYVKYNKTGNPLFFNQTKSGEELRALSKDTLTILDQGVIPPKL